MKAIKENSLLKLEHFGQSIWMDFIRRGTIVSGELKGGRAGRCDLQSIHL